MKTFTCVARYVMILCLLLFSFLNVNAQRIYATSQDSGATGLLCVNCTVTNPGNATDGNVETYSSINVTVGLAAQTYQELIFGTTPVAANTPVTVKLGTGNNLVSATVLGGITLQAYNGTTAIGQPVAASTLISAVANNNQVEVSITPTAAYDRIRVTLNGGLVGALSSLYLYAGFYNGTGAGVCNSPIDDLYGISSGLLNLGAAVGGVVNPQNAYDGNLTTYSTLNAGVGAVGATAQQTIIFEAPSVQGDSVKLTLSLPQSLLAAGVLSNVAVSTYNGTSGTAETYYLNSSLINVQLLGILGGYQNLTVTYAPQNIFDRVQVTLGGGIANVLSTLNLYEVQKTFPSPVIKFNGVVASVAPICSGTSATLTAVAQPNTTFLWYTTATGGSPIFTGGTYTTPALTANATYYVAAMRSGCTDQSARTAITVYVNAMPGNPVITNPTVTVCPGQPATFTAQAVAGVTINWFTAATGGTAIATGNTFTTPALTATTSYYAEAQSGGTCVSPARTMVTATVSPLPAAPTIGTPNVTICPNNSAVFTITQPVTGVTYNWYSTATGGTSLYTGTTFTTPALTATTSYYAEADNATGCPSSTRSVATATVSPLPADPTLAATNQTIAAGQTATISVTNAQSGVTYNWYASATAASPVYTGTTYTTPALYANTTYYVSGVNATGCQSADRVAITITVNINNNTPCAFANNQSSSINNICIGCGVTNNNLAIDADTTTASTISVLAGLVGGSASQQLIFPQPGYAGDTVKLELGAPASLLNAGVAANVTVALYNGTTLVESYPLTSNLLTVNLLTGSSRYAVYIPATGAYDRVQVTLNSSIAGLINSLNVYYAVQDYPKPVFSSANPEICSGGTDVINITSPTNGTFQFYNAPTGGTVVGTGSSFTTPALTTTTTYYVAYTRGTCTSPNRYPITISVDAPPAAPVVNPSTASIYSGQTATFTATAPTNATVNWYTAATGGTPVFTGNTFTTPALTANTTYYAESALGSCVSTTRTPATVTVQPVVVPDVTVTPPTQTINAGTTATLTASSTTPGTIFNWFTTATGGTSIYTGATFTTPSLFANTTYYAQATVTASGTVSATRAAGVINIASSIVNPTPCDAAIAETTDINGLVCLGCAINNEAAAVDGDRNTFSQLDVPVGLLNAYAQQTLRFANTGIAGDSVIVELGVPGNLASVGVLSGISLATYNSTTYNNDMTNLNTNLISVTVLNGSTRFRYAFAATAAFDRVQIRLNSTASVLNALNIYDAYEEVAAPVVATSTVNSCQGAQATLTATASADATVRWYSTATGGTPLYTGNTFNTPALTTTTTYYAEASRTADGCTQAIRTPATVNVLPTPAAPVVAAPNQTICSGSTATFAATPVTGITFNWYTAATGGTPIFTGPSFTTPALTASTTYYVEADNAGSCPSATRTTVNATVTTTPPVPTVAQSPVQICSGSSAVLTAMSAQSGVTFNWYTTPTGGTPVYTGAQFTTPALTANTSYYVEAANGTCVSATRAEDDVIVNPPPANPVVTTTPANGQITSGQTATLAATSATAGVTFNWYTTATGGTPVYTGATYVTPALFSNTTYYVEADNSTTGCPSAQRTAVNITVNTIFNTTCDFASSQSNTTSGVLCVGCGVINPNNAVDADTTTYSELDLTVALLNAYVAQTLTFSDPGIVGDTVAIRMRIPAALLSAAVLGNIQIQSYNGATANNDAVTLNSSTIKVQLLSGSQDVLVKFVPSAAYNAVQVTLVDNVLGALSTLDIFYATKQVEKPQLAASTVNICSGGTATFTVSNARTGLTYTWFNSGGIVVHTGTSYTTGALSTTTTYYVQSSRTATGCANPNKVAATANVTPSPVPPILAQNAVQICAGSTVTLAVTNGTGYTVNWYDAATGGNLLFTGANYPVSPVATTTYYAELTNGTCTSPSRGIATVTVNPLPLQPAVQSANITVCPGSTATITIVGPQSGITYSYYTVATGGVILGSGTSFTTPAITQNTTYYVEASNGAGCINNGGRTVVNINVTNPVNAPTLSATSIQVCNGGSVSISVTNPVAGLTYNWYDAATGGNLVFTGTTFTANNLTTSVSYFVEADNSTGCASPTRTETDINVTPIPTPPQVQPLAGGNAVCSGSTATLMIVNPQVNNVYSWYDAATNGNLLYTGTEFTTPALTTATTYYVVAATAGNCNPSAATAVTININALPADPVLVNNAVAVCSGSPATLAVSSSQAGVTYNWYDSPTETNLLFTGTTYITGPITNTTDFYVSAVNATGCTSTNLAMAQVTVQPAPAAPSLTNTSTVTTCSGSQVTLSIANPQAGYTYNFYADATGGSSLASGTSYTTAVLTANTTFYVDATNSTGCTSATRTAVTITIATPPAPPTAGTTGTAICTGNATTITTTTTDPTATISWFAAVAGGTALSTGNSFTTPILTGTTTYYAEADNSGGCPSATRTPVVVTVSPLPDAAIAGTGGTSICTNTATRITATSTDATATITWYDAATGGNLLATGNSYTTPVLTANTTYYAQVTNTTGCTSSARTPVTVTVNTVPPDPTLVSANVSVCSGSNATLAVNAPQAGVTYNWYDALTGGNLLFTGSTYVTGAITTPITFYVAAVNGSGCNSVDRVQAQVTIQAAPTAPVVTTPGIIQTCVGTSVTISISNPQAGYTYNWYTAATGGSTIFTGVSFVTPALTAGTTYYVDATNSTGCTSASRTAVSISVTPSPDAPTVSSAGTSICPNNTTTLTATVNDPNAVITWYDAATGGNTLTTGGSFTTPVLSANTTYYVGAINTASGCTSASRTAVTVTILQPLQAPVLAVSATTISSVTFAWNTITGATGYQVSLNGGNTFIDPGSGSETYTVSGLNPGQSVTLIVRALGASTCELSANSNAATGTAQNPEADAIFVPNAFTPNGDGKNDIEYVYGSSINSLNFYVYNQWGELIFQTNSKSTGWDGTYKGTTQPVGVYVYYVEAIMNDGKHLMKKGTITLLR